VLSELYYGKAAFVKAARRKQLPLVQLLFFLSKSRYKKQNQTHRGVLGRKKGVLKSENDNYLGTKFEF
jgi:hypothetical protein